MRAWRAYIHPARASGLQTARSAWQRHRDKIPNHRSDLVILRVVTGGRCWVRTNVGEADGFTDRFTGPIGMATDLVKLPYRPREYPALSAIVRADSDARRLTPRTDTDSVRTSNLTCSFTVIANRRHS